jgi:hypothetical protein
VNYPLQPATAATGLVAGDFNGDGKLDLVVTGITGTASTYILLGNGDGTFKTHLDSATPNFPYAIAEGDFNGDGIPDLVAIEGTPAGGQILAATCSVSPSSITLNGTTASGATVTVTTTAASFLPPSGDSPGEWPLLLLIALAAILFAAVELRWNNKMARPVFRYARMVTLAAVLCSAALAVGCGGGSSASTSNTVQGSGTPAGSYP